MMDGVRSFLKPKLLEFIILFTPAPNGFVPLFMLAGFSGVSFFLSEKSIK
jgi:hypothetical protein